MVDRAAALAYFGILSLFPSLLLVVSVARLLGGADVGADVAGYARDRGVSEALAATVRTSLETAQAAGTTGAGTLGLVGLGTLVYGASKGFTAAGRALDAIGGAGARRRSLVRRAKDVGWTVLLIGLATVGLLLAALSGRLLRDTLDLIGLPSAAAAAWSVLRWPLIALLGIAVVAVVRHAAPTTRRGRTPVVTPGTLATVAIWLISTVGYMVYVSELATYNATYGAFAGAVILLLWIWLSAISFLCGAELDAVLATGGLGSPASDDAPEPSPELHGAGLAAPGPFEPVDEGAVMPLGRRRPLMRAAMVGGTAYVAGKHAQAGQQHEAEQDQQIAATEQAPPAAAAPVAAPASGTDRVAALTQLKGLLDAGVLTQAEFDVEKQKILQGS
jgi:membrane protein